MKRNVLLAFGVKAGSIAISLILVPATINFVNPTQYGIWLVISSMVAWMSFFDIGFSNGLRNKLAESLAHEDYDKGCSYLSTTYAMLSGIFSVVLLLLLCFIWLFDIAPLINIESTYESDLKVAASILVAYFCIGFVIRTLSFVLKADMRTAYASGIEFLGQAGVLATILILRENVEGSLSILALALCLPPFIVWTIASIILYRTRYKKISPKLNMVRKEEVHSLLGLSVKFFVINIAFIIQFQTSSFLISRLFSVTEVTSYNIVYKYFNVMYMAFFLIIDPFWSAVTDAWSKGDRAWIMRATRKYLMFAGLWLAGGLVMLAVSPWVYDFWINSKVDEPIHFPFELSAWMLCYVMVIIWGQIFCMFVNGIGALKIQFHTSLISPIVFVASTIILARVFGLGMECVLIGSILANFNGLILAPLQYYMVMHKNKQGIWVK